MKKAKIIIMILLVMIISVGKVKASTISYDYSKYYVRTTDYPFSNTDNSWSNALNFGEYYNTTDIGYVNGIRARFGVNTKFNANTKYRVKINVKFNNDTDKSIYLNADSIICQGSSTSTWSSDENLIDSCRFVARTYYNENKNASYLFDIIPNTNIYGIQIAFYIKGSQFPYWSGDRIQAIRVLASSNITTDTSTSDTINNSTTEIIYNNNKNTEDIINNQNELLGSKCENLYTGNTHIGTDNKIALDLSNLTCGKTYTISSVNNVYVYKFSERASSSSGSDVGPEKWSGTGIKTWTFEYTGHKYLFVDTTSSAGTHFVDKANVIKAYKFMVVEGTTSKSYCEYGTYQSKLDKDHNYNTNPSETINGQNDIDSVNNAENGLLNQIDLTGVNMDVSINSNTSNFIWYVIQRLRSINGAIVLLFTSILGLGLIKLILNR